MNGRYILDAAHNAVPCEDLFEWGAWMQTADRHVAEDNIGGIRISTVFLGLDHRFDGDGPPIVFETMTFGEPKPTKIFGETRMLRESLGQWRYSTWDEALKGHAEAVAGVKRHLAQ